MTTIDGYGVPQLRVIPLRELRESALNTRRHFDPVKLAELRESIAKSGILTPLLVRPFNGRGKGSFELAAGHRRLRAAREAGITEAPCIVQDLDDATFLEILTVENLQAPRVARERERA